MRTVRKAFTLVEILIVVVILGILAAIVVPQFTNATRDAQGGNIMTQLDTLNNQIELYKARNNGQNPADLQAGGAAGTAAAGPWATLIGGGYIKSIPVNPACPNAAAGGDPGAVLIGAAAANSGWNFVDTNADSVPDTLEACYFNETTGVVTTTP